MRLSEEQRSQLRSMGFTHAVVIGKDVSIEVIGSVQSVHSHSHDAAAEAKRLSLMYSSMGEESNGFIVEKL